MVEEEVGLDTHMGLGLPVPGTSSSKQNLNRPQPRDVSRAALAEAVGGRASGFCPPGLPSPSKEPHSCC